MEKNNHVVYTVLTSDGYDDLIKLVVRNPRWDYICLTDNPNLQSDFWEIRLIEETDIDEVKKSRKYKINPHLYFQNYECSLYIDANCNIVGDIDDYILRYARGRSLLCVVHPERDCIYEEARVCVNLHKDNKWTICRQMEKYSKEYRYPEHYGLIAGGFIYRKNNDAEVIAVMSDWWEEVKCHSRRDQLSFNFAAWKNHYQYSESDVFCYKNGFFYFEPHNKLKSFAQLFWGVDTALLSEENSLSQTIPHGNQNRVVLTFDVSV